MSRSRWIILLGSVGSLPIPVLVGKILDVSGSFPAAFGACAAFEALALVCTAFTRETGCASGPSW
jgi:hypothetical protein